MIDTKAHAVRGPKHSVRTLLPLMTLLAAAGFARPSDAHHSSAIFDANRSVTLHGTVKLFQWNNPHCFIQVLVPVHSAPAEWSVEMGSPSQLYRNGWRPGTLQPGEKVTIVIHPTKDGTKAGEFVSGTGSSGMPLKAASPQPQS